MKRPFDENEKRKNALIIDDSSAQYFLNFVLENNRLNYYQISTLYISIRCQLFCNDELLRIIESNGNAFCNAMLGLVKKALEQIAEVDLIKFSII